MTTPDQALTEAAQQLRSAAAWESIAAKSIEIFRAAPVPLLQAIELMQRIQNDTAPSRSEP